MGAAVKNFLVSGRSWKLVVMLIFFLLDSGYFTVFFFFSKEAVLHRGKEGGRKRGRR